MKKGIKYLFGFSFFLVFLTGIFFWFEAEKEVRILCTMFEDGQAKEHVFKTLDTGNLLEYRPVSSGDTQGVIVDSPFMLRTGRCTLRFATDGTVQSSAYRQTFKLEKIAAWMGITGLLLMAFLHILAAAVRSPRLKIGRLGKNRLLPNHQIVPGIYALTLAAGAFFLLERSGITHTLPNTTASSYAVWGLVILLGFATAINREGKTRYGNTLMVFSLCCCIIVAMAG